MITLNISELQTHNRESMLQHLLSQNDTSFEISLLLYPMPTPGNREYIHRHYLVASYVGQLLKGISRRFAYNVPGVASLPLFIFRARITDMNKLAEILLMISNACLSANEYFYQFQKGMDAFLDRLKQNNLNPAAGGLIYVANKYTN